MRKDSLSITFFAIILICLLTGCHEEKKYRIGVSQCSFDDWRIKMNDEINREIMFHDDATVEIRSANDSNEKQIADIRYFIDEKFDIIIASPNEADAITPIIKEAYEKGIPVIVFDRNINGNYYTAYQGADNRAIGESAALFTLSEWGKNGLKIIEIQGNNGSTPAVERHEGFIKVVNSHPRLKILGSGDGEWNDEKGRQVADSLLDLFPDAELIFAHNDRMAIAGAEAARERGLSNIKVVGIDGAPNIGIKAVADSIIDATFLYPTEGQDLIRTALHILKNEPYEKLHILPSPMAIDRSNAELLLLQAETIKDETQKIEWLKKEVDKYWDKHSAQTTLLYSTIIILLLLSISIFLLLKAYWSHRRHQRILGQQNKQLERQRDQLIELNAQLKDATQAKLMFFTNVSHDLRTPLTLIADPIEQMKEAGNLTEKQHMLMHLADKNVKILKRLINQILDFRKYENGKMELSLRETDLRQCVLEWADSFKSLSIKKHIRLSIDMPETIDFTMAVDIEKMERIFFNLMSNAFKFTPANGSIIAKFRSDGQVLEFAISDTGRGMTEEDSRHVFERFFQADKIQPNGSGIGLALVKSFVELHGGEISVRSEIGKGSTFTAKIPVKHIAQKEPTPGKLIGEDAVFQELEDIEIPEMAAGEHSGCILVIDDNADMRALVGSLFDEQFTILDARDGQQGVKLATKYIPDLIICDMMMPVMDGLECCRRIKEDVSTSHIPILMLTACSLDEQRIQGYKCGADAYISKPFNTSVLKARCEALIINRKRIKDAFSTEPIIIGSEMKPATPPQRNDIDNDFYRKFKELVDKEIGNSELSIEELGAQLGLSRVQFYRKIKALTNYSPVELVRTIRLKRAAALLKSSEHSVSEISYQVGFSSPSYFAKCFKDYFGESPSELQQRTSKITDQ